MFGLRLRIRHYLILLLTVFSAPHAIAQTAQDADALILEVGAFWRDGKYAMAMPLAKRALTIRETVFGPHHPKVAESLRILAALNIREGHLGEAGPLMTRALQIDEKELGSDHPEFAKNLCSLGGFYDRQGRLLEAETLYLRCLDTERRTKGPDHIDVGNIYGVLGTLYQRAGKFDSSVRALEKGLDIMEGALGPDDPQIATMLGNLAEAYYNNTRRTEVEPLLKRSLAIRERALGPDHPKVAVSLLRLGTLYASTGDYADAEPILLRVLLILERTHAADDPMQAVAIRGLAQLYARQGRDDEAEQAMKRTLEIQEKSGRFEHADTADDLRALAEFYLKRGRAIEAEPIAIRAVEIFEKSLGPEHIDLLAPLSCLARIALGRGDWNLAFAYWSRAATIKQLSADLNFTQEHEDAVDGEIERGVLIGLIKSAWRQIAAGSKRKMQDTSGIFEVAQRVQLSEAATSIAQMSARSRAPLALAGIVRERQDLVTEREVTGRQVSTQRSILTDSSGMAAVKGLVDRLSEIDARLGAIETRFRNEFPDYINFVRPRPTAAAGVQASLHDNEALLLFLDTDAEFVPLPEETFIWVVTKNDMRWLRSELGTKALQEHVAALRCGLDLSAWSVDSKPGCAQLLRLPLGNAPRQGKELPFDPARAHKLYEALLGGATDLIRDKKLLVVPSGPLATIPFSTLVTKRPSSREVGDAHWLIQDHAVTVLPSVASLIALRRNERPSGATKPFIAFANPLLDGDPSDRARADEIARRAKSVRRRVDCSNSLYQNIASFLGLRRVAPIPTTAALADVALLRAQTPLPETADEACDVARALNADQKEVRLGARATESEVKSLSESGVLAKFRVLHFATHATVAGQLSPASEPGLILTPPDVGTERDDGYLSASEVAGLRLDADWVILSACNTASGEGEQSAEALSGLARAFFYAGARSLVVSHWEVETSAAVKLTTVAVKELAANASIGRSEALRRSMLSLIKNGTENQKHPAYWAPFVLVGKDDASTSMR